MEERRLPHIVKTGSLRKVARYLQNIFKLDDLVGYAHTLRFRVQDGECFAHPVAGMMSPFIDSQVFVSGLDSIPYQIELFLRVYWFFERSDLKFRPRKIPLEFSLLHRVLDFALRLYFAPGKRVYECFESAALLDAPVQLVV